MDKKILVGGQAVIEGVMMRVPGAYATAVRTLDGDIRTERKDHQSFTEKHPIFKKPILRGMISLIESMKIGFGTLQWSADIAIEEEQKRENKKIKKESKLTTFLSTVFALVLGVGLFLILPLFLTTKLLNIEKQAFYFNIVAGSFRILFFLCYLWIISLLKDVKILFQYHGAEHKTVFAFEDGQELTVENVRPYTTFHPRCGTSFIFIILIVSILMYALIDLLVILAIGDINLPIRIIFHLALLPLVSGVGYEFLKMTAQYQEKPFFAAMTQPGLWLQRITTQEPTDEQLEIAITALKTAFGSKYSEYAGQKYKAEAID
ncbi:MAG: DUF1385 domain-containing protein [Candidatus Marinimicrobia bacterium]|nr:DUF1385 domain-containing protein [Candidatus Neomarinimicrobiota bacterium]